MKFFDKLRYSLARKLYGSYGIDQLGRFLSFLVTFMLIISIVLSFGPSFDDSNVCACFFQKL